MLFAGLGIWLIFRKNTETNSPQPLSLRNEMIVFALIIGIVGAYAGSTFSRLELLTATSVIVLSSVGLTAIVSEILRKEEKHVKVTEPSKKGASKGKKTIDLLGRIPKISFVAVIVAILLVPTMFSVNANWISMTKAPPTILNGGSNYAISTDDWPVTLNWIKTNTPKDSVVASWWDYGYWIQTLGERKSLADNATIDTERIATIARMFLSSPDDAWKTLREMGANYVLVYVVGQKFISNGQELYVLGGGGDESKKQWFIRIAGENLSKFLEEDQFTPTKYFWQNTIFGQISIKLLNNVAPKTVSNFEKLANSGFYRGTIFHRIMPGFVIQAGDPNTINGSRDIWGLGDAGHTIPPEFNTMKFTKYMVGMARGSDVNSGSSQFFITFGDAPWLSGQYKIG